MGLLYGTRRALLGKKSYIQKVLSYNPIAYWPLNERNGTTANCLINPAQNGTYARDVTLMGTGAGIGDGNTAPVFTPGSSDNVNIYSATLAATFNGSAGTAMAWIKVSGAGVWTDGQYRQVLYLAVDGGNYAMIGQKYNTNNRFRVGYNAGGTAENVYYDPYSSVAWFCAAITWDKAADEFRAYLNGSQYGLTQTVLGNWVGALAANTTAIGITNTALLIQPWDGYIAHVAVWNTALSPGQISLLAAT